MRKKLRRILWAAAALVAVLTGGLYAADELGPQRELTADTAVHFIDVGQGDSALLLSGGQAVLIDAGTAESGAAVVRYLEELGVTELYGAVATHPHADHIGGMAQVIEAFPIEHFYLGPETQNTATYSGMLDALEEAGVQPVIPADGDELVFDSGASLTFLGPADDVPKSNLNDRSLITLFRAGRIIHGRRGKRGRGIPAGAPPGAHLRRAQGGAPRRCDLLFRGIPAGRPAFHRRHLLRRG